MKALSKKELIIINKVMGYIQDVEMEGQSPDWVSDLVESDEFNSLNEKIAELIADA